MIYVILAHHSPKALQRLVATLQSTDNHFVIHIDNNSEITPFREALKKMINCHFTPESYSSQWGSFGLIEATLHAFDFIRRHLRKRQRIVLLSGADYPIKSEVYIKEYLKSHKHTVFIEYKAIPRAMWYKGGVSRFPLYEQIKECMDLYGGSQWFSIPPQALTIIFQFLKVNPDFVEYFKHVKIPDESFFQTLFLNCKRPYILKNLRNQNLHLIKWEKPFNHPRIMTMKDYGQIKKSKSLFARKFEPTDSRELLQKLDLVHSGTDKYRTYKTAIIYLTSRANEGIESKFSKLKTEVTQHRVFRVVTKNENYEQSGDTLLYEHHYYKQLGYIPLDEQRIIPGCTYFAILYFRKHYPDYDYYWLVEDDVWYNGDWSKFFKSFEGNNADLVSAYLTSYKEAPHWYWWNTLVTESFVPNYYKMRTFYPICRFSAQSLDYLDQRLKKGDHGHGEVLVPTLLYLHGLSFYDIANNEDKLIIPSDDRAIGDRNNGSFRYRPFIAPEEIHGEYLFHPVKEDVQ